jgi:hypothetical protein
VDRLEILEGQARGVGRQVRGLPGAGAFGADGAGELADDAGADPRRRLRRLRGDLEGARDERQGRELRRGDAVRHVDRRAAAAPPRVVHGRQVV